MATSRPVSLIIPSGIFDENNTSKDKSSDVLEHSSSSSIDSSSAQATNSIKRNSNEPIMLTNTTPTTTTTTTTTTDSDFDSEQDDPIQSKKEKTRMNREERTSRQVKRFHKLFKSEIKDHMPDLIDSYVCAYQGDILLQGKMYITDRYLCFHSRIISYVTKHVYRWEQIQSVTKERVAFIFPTAIGIQLKQSGKKIIYASFLQRDQAYDKILFIWSRSTNDTNSFGDDENDFANEGTLKAETHHARSTYPKRESYGIIDESNHEHELHMYLQQTNDNKRRLHSISSKSSDEKQVTKQSLSAPQKRTMMGHVKLEQKLTNGSGAKGSASNQTNRHSRHGKSEQKHIDKTARDHSASNHRSHSGTSKVHPTHSNDLRLPSNSTALTQPSPPPTHVHSSHGDTRQYGMIAKIFNTMTSLLNIILNYLLSLVEHFKIYPLKTTVVLLLFITLLFFHSFYLIKLAYRIEHRLHSLYHLWPAPSTRKPLFSSPSMKNSLPSTQDL